FWNRVHSDVSLWMSVQGGIDAEERFGITDEARAVAIGVRRFEVAGEGLLIEAAGENGLDGAIEDAVVGQGASTGGFQPRCTVAFGQTQHALSSTKPFNDAISEQAFDELTTG